ncbi:MAG: efflux transporter periplasmic adaptor subunit, partial [Rhodothermales bacterium]|nr:efflux transporter periplasmic adaptor subunit [Rhodothermales bacterium]
MSKRTVWISIGVVVILAIVLALGLGGSGLSVETDTVESRTIRVVISEEGQTRVVDRYAIAAPVSGMLDRIELREGDVVEMGDELAKIRPLPSDSRSRQVLQAGLQAALARRSQAEIQVEQSTAQLAQAERDLGRIRSLARDSIISRQELEAAELGLESARQAQAAARATLAGAGADVSAARASLSGSDLGGSGRPLVIRAPDAGRILLIPERSERAVAAGTPLMELGNADALEIVVDVLSED